MDRDDLDIYAGVACVLVGLGAIGLGAYLTLVAGHDLTALTGLLLVGGTVDAALGPILATRGARRRHGGRAAA